MIIIYGGMRYQRGSEKVWFLCKSKCGVGLYIMMYGGHIYNTELVKPIQRIFLPPCIWCNRSKLKSMPLDHCMNKNTCYLCGGNIGFHVKLWWFFMLAWMSNWRLLIWRLKMSVACLTGQVSPTVINFISFWW